MTALPSGTVTFLFTDVESSTMRWERNPEAMQMAMERHDNLVRSSIEAHRGVVFKTVGDAFCAAFRAPYDALSAAIAIQHSVGEESWPEGCELQMRVALHSGIAQERDNDYFGPTLNRVARLLAVGHGGQVLVSLPCAEMLRDSLPPEVLLLDLGERRLKDLTHPERIFQVVAPGLHADFPSLRVARDRPTNLPVQVTSFVGRTADVAALSEMLSREGVRLLVLTGPGGTGKTRLAVRAAQEILDRYPDGVFFVALSSVTDPALVPETIARNVAGHVPGGTPNTSPEELFQSRKILLVLDNFEQVLSAGSFLSKLLTACPKLTILVTSRAALGVYGEQNYPVHPLSSPDSDAPPDYDDLSRYESVMLLVERARSVRPDFALTETNAPAIAGICSRLDGLPLAIELAAARLRVLSPRALLERLARRLDVLTNGSQDLPARQQTLRGAISWSFDALPLVEQVVFRRLAVFADGCTLDAAEAVLGSGDGIDLFDAVAALVNWSFLREDAGPDGEPRFAMLETLREFGIERLNESGEGDEFRRRHATYFADIGRAAETVSGARQETLLQRLVCEHGNLRAALYWAMEAEESGTAAVLAGALWDSGVLLAARR